MEVENTKVVGGLIETSSLVRISTRFLPVVVKQHSVKIYGE
jgi:hypothetical protein